VNLFSKRTWNEGNVPELVVYQGFGSFKKISPKRGNPRGLPAMTSIVDSTAHFAQRMKDVNMSEGGQRAVLAAGFDTLGKLAFGRGQPSAPIEQRLFDRFAVSNF